MELDPGNSVGDNIQLLNWDKDVTLKNVDEFRMAIWKLLESDQRKLILELTDVAYLNSAALGVIADAVLTAGRSDKELVMAGIQSTVEEIFQIVHFSTFMKIFIEVNEAYTYFQSLKK
ncbi:STAS domain-containing protein [Paenibacillus sp. 19GGS1-52]|uniref:STAS domain-containing protein n=1 Tax=Paenibacillus sp. 19GGS1-52 TaxID=2758563 RepID=UPI001EFBB609|nr:STAS domain-containing protein [Paenibacillus sp. 19GGS1-52]ULO10584.1 STAS domain-containing protein [Paenibacillus sp. 19GGS1-52]